MTTRRSFLGMLGVAPIAARFAPTPQPVTWGVDLARGESFTSIFAMQGDKMVVSPRPYVDGELFNMDFDQAELRVLANTGPHTHWSPSTSTETR